jgi:hypothetical protein
MIIHDVPQGSLAWHRLRAGIPTASEFSRILTPGGKASKQAQGYLHELLAEWVVGHAITGPETEWMARGHDLEEQAAAAYEFHAEVKTELVGFVTTDDGMLGASPDRLVGDKRLLEIKCLKPSGHVAYMLGVENGGEFKPQLQGQLYVTDREAVDNVFYCPEMPPIVLSVARDEVYIGKLKSALDHFVEELQIARLDLERRFGPFIRAAPADESAAVLGVTDDDPAAMISHHEQLGTWNTEAR